MIHASYLITTACMILLLGACGTSAPVRYYNLDPIDLTYRPDDANAPVLGLGPLRLPEYLARTQMVTRGPGSELIVDEYNRWAEPLDQAIHRIVASNVDSLVNGVSVVAFPYNSLIEVDYRLIGRVDQFETGQNGRAVFSVQWSITDKNSRILVPARRARYESRAARPDDPGLIAQAMNGTIAQFSRDIATNLESALR